MKWHVIHEAVTTTPVCVFVIHGAIGDEVLLTCFNFTVKVSKQTIAKSRQQLQQKKKTKEIITIPLKLLPANILSQRVDKKCG